MNVKYQIFVSSTYDDLRKEREQIIKAILEMGHIPVGMEMFSAADTEQWKIIARQIDECDYYAVIVAHRYGSVVDGISYTEKEYDYALKQGVPTIGFIIDDDASWPASMVDSETEGKENLALFKEKLKRKPVGLWSSANDLYGKFAIALMKLFNANPRPGWARASEVVGPQVMMELSRLSHENATLRDQLEKAQKKSNEDALAERESMLRTLLKNKVKLRWWLKGGRDWSDGPEISLYKLFRLLAPECVIEKSTNQAANYLSAMLKDKTQQLRDEWPMPSNSIRERLTDLMTLGLMEPSHRKHAVADLNEYWSLTEKGRELLSYIRRQSLDLGETTNPAPVTSEHDKSTQ